MSKQVSSDFRGQWIYWWLVATMSSLPHAHTMDKTMVNHSSSDFIRYYCSLPLLTTLTSCHANSSSYISIHCRASQTSPLWTGLLSMSPPSLATSVISLELLCSSGVTCAHHYAALVHLNENVEASCLNRWKVLMVLPKEWLIVWHCKSEICSHTLQIQVCIQINHCGKRSWNINHP